MATQFLSCTNPHATGFWQKYAVGITRFATGYAIALGLITAFTGNETVSDFLMGIIMFIVPSVALAGGTFAYTLRSMNDKVTKWAGFCNKYGMLVLAIWWAVGSVVGMFWLMDYDDESFAVAFAAALFGFVINAWTILVWLLKRNELLAGVDAVRNNA